MEKVKRTGRSGLSGFSGLEKIGLLLIFGGILAISLHHKNLIDILLNPLLIIGILVFLYGKGKRQRQGKI